MELNAKEVREGGQYIGQELQIYDFRWEDFDKKPARKIKPTKVLIRSNSETKQTVNYSQVFLSEIKNDKLIKSSTIKIYDNTGWRGYPGVPVNIFTTEKECVDKYKELKEAVIENFNAYKSKKQAIISAIEYELNI